MGPLPGERRTGDDASAAGGEAGPPGSREDGLEREAAKLRRALARAQDRARRAERALRERTERYRMIARATNDVIWDWDLTTGRVEWNEAVRSVFRYSPAEVGQTADWWKNHIHPEDRERVVTGIMAVIDGGGEYWSAEYRFRRGDGTYATVFDRGYVAHDEAGRPVRMVGSMVDVTDRKAAEEELRSTEARLRLALEAARLGDWELDLKTHVSPRRSLHHDRIFGYTEPIRDWSYERFMEHVLPADRAQVDRRFRSALESGRPWDFECRIRHADGEVRWIGAKAGIVYDAEGRPDRAFGVVMDITERKRGEEALRQAKEEAEQASRAKSNFLAVMSHELRTPLNAILGYAALLEDEVAGPLNPKQKANVQRMRESGKHLLGLIEQVLSLSRIEAGRAAIAPEPFDASTLAREAADAAEPLARRKDLAFTAEIPDRPVWMTSDPDRIRQILLNLLSNAVKFTDAGAVTLRLRATEDSADFEVADSGPGIAPEDRERIFQPFEQAETGTTRAKGGTGLGLSVSREIARLLGGTLTLESEMRKGSTFTLRLPRRYGADTRAPRLQRGGGRARSGAATR